MIEHSSVRVLVVGDVATDRMIIRNALISLPGIELVACGAEVAAFLAKLEDFGPDVVILDMDAASCKGFEILQRLRRLTGQIGKIVLSASSSGRAQSKHVPLGLGALDFVTKPDSRDPFEQVRLMRQNLYPKIDAYLRARQAGGACSTSPMSAQAHVAVPPQFSAVASGRVDLVVIGISTGGPPALHCMLPMLPADLACPVLIVQHMPPGFTEPLALGLDNHCALKVVEASHGQPILPGHILIAPGGMQMKVLRDGGEVRVCIADDPPEHGCSPAVDYLLRSVVDAYGAKALAVIMTGMGHDGAEGCRQLKDCGALIIAQDEASCVVFGMPKDVVRSGIADAVVPLQDIAAEIVSRVGRLPAKCR